MSFRSSFGFSKREDLPPVEQKLLEKIEADMGEPLQRSTFWSMGYQIEYDRLIRLWLRGNYGNRRFSVIPNELVEATELIQISWAINRIKEIPEQIGNLTKLGQLFMGNNLIEEVPESITELCNVEVVELQNNRIGEFPEGIAGMKRLSDLSLGNNQLDTLPHDLGDAPKLRSLRIPYNNIRTLPNSLAEANLNRIRYGDNNVQELPEWIGEWSNLNELLLHNNNISELPESMGKLNNLEVLDLRDNDLKEIPIHILGQLDELKEVYIRGNPFTKKSKKKFKAMARLLPKRIRIDGMKLNDYFHKSDLF